MINIKIKSFGIDLLLPGAMQYREKSCFAAIQANHTIYDYNQTIQRVNPQKAIGRGKDHGPGLRTCSDHMAGIFGDIFNLSRLHSEIPIWFKKRTIIPMPKKIKVAYRHEVL